MGEREREREGAFCETVNQVPGNDRVWVVSCDCYRSSHWQRRSHSFTLGPPSHPISPPNQCRLYSLHQCQVLLLDSIKIHLQPVSEKTHLSHKQLSSSPPVLLCVLKHIHTCLCLCFGCRLENGRELPERLLCVVQSSLLPPGIQMGPKTFVGFFQG